MMDGRPKDNEEKDKCSDKKIQKTGGVKALREIRKNQYIKAKKEYQTAIRKDKTRSWKQYCTMTSPINPWNEVYKLVTSKARSRSTVETHQKPDGSKTENMEGTLKLILDLMIPKDHPPRRYRTPIGSQKASRATDKRHRR